MTFPMIFIRTIMTILIMTNSDKNEKNITKCEKIAFIFYNIRLFIWICK